MPSRADIETTLGHLALFACTGLWFGEPEELRTLVNHIADLEVEAREKAAWEGRYQALLEEAEASRPRTVEGDGSDLPFGTVVIDKGGDAWQHYETSGWEVIGGCFCTHHALPDDGAPYTIVWTPEENTNE